MSVYSVWRCDTQLNDTKINDTLRNKLNFDIFYCYFECRYAECRYVECCYDECRQVECRSTKCRGALCLAYSRYLNSLQHSTSSRWTYHKTYSARNLGMFGSKLECLSTESISSLVLCLWVRLEPIQVNHYLVAPLQGRILALPTNIRLGWKGLLATNTLAYFDKHKKVL